MAIVDSVDGESRRIFLHSDSVGVDLHPIDIYKEVRALRRTDESLRKFDNFLEAKGNDPKGSGKFTERYVVCLDGTRIIPYDTTQVLNVIGTVITDDEQEGVACFDRTGLTITSRVDINYVPPQVEVIEVNTAGVTPNQIADAVWDEAL